MYQFSNKGLLVQYSESVERGMCVYSCYFFIPSLVEIGRAVSSTRKCPPNHGARR